MKTSKKLLEDLEFSEPLAIRLTNEQKARVILQVKKHPELYDSPSHFVRASIIRELKRIDREDLS